MLEQFISNVRSSRNAHIISTGKEYECFYLIFYGGGVTQAFSKKKFHLFVSCRVSFERVTFKDCKNIALDRFCIQISQIPHLFQILEEEAKCSNTTKRVTCSLVALRFDKPLTGIMYNFSTEHSFCSTSNVSFACSVNYDLICEEDIETVTGCLYRTPNFWLFVIFMSIGTIGFNVANSISDAICFDVIGKSSGSVSFVKIAHLDCSAYNLPIIRCVIVLFYHQLLEYSRQIVEYCFSLQEKQMCIEKNLKIITTILNFSNTLQ